MGKRKWRRVRLADLADRETQTRLLGVKDQADLVDLEKAALSPEAAGEAKAG